MTVELPCQQGDPDDWFIRNDGKQYPSDEFLTDDERRRVALSVLSKVGETAAELEARMASAIEAAEREHRRQALIRRRKAKQACFTDCPVRGACLDIAIEARSSHGTWGGYYEEELAQVYVGMDNRARRGLPL